MTTGKPTPASDAVSPDALACAVISSDVTIGQLRAAIEEYGAAMQERGSDMASHLDDAEVDRCWRRVLSLLGMEPES